ncbi:hypothetical protein D9613_000081 [Agrocybe pediades]|uniref:Transposase n=1 Tax=Agrocybe pediades TaxID=84607 RepID=A0A8H4R2V0_9AGAR|nr:hypothetical protein D9613_000081 [Agrocybe pediades]
MARKKTTHSEYDSATKNKLIGAIVMGATISEAGRRFGVSKTSAHRIWKRYESQGNTENLPRSGRPSKVNDRMRRCIVQTARKNRRMPLTEVAKNIPANISISTIRRVLAKEGYHRRCARKVPYLTNRHKSERLSWAKLYKGFTRENWKSVIWSDECYIYLGDSHSRIYVTRRPDEEYKEECVVPTFKQSSVWVMVWGCIMEGEKGPLIVLNYPGGKGGGMNSKLYREQVLDGCLKSYYEKKKAEKGKVYFQQDGAPSHRSKATQQWFQESGIKLLFHPASSPDLNPIEPVWHELKQVLRRLDPPPSNVESLSKAVLEAWEQLPVSDVNKHIKNMPKRISAVLASKGGHTRF